MLNCGPQITNVVFLLLICSTTGKAVYNNPYGTQFCRVLCNTSQNSDPKEVLVYHGASDASAAVALNNEMFIVADDENNILRVYKTTCGSLPVFSYDLTQFLSIEPEHPEADIEGATMTGDRIYWISSHGRNKDGEMRPNRYRFFATSVKVENENVTIRPVGKPCKTLVHALIRAENMRHLGLGQATQFDALKLTKKQRKELAPKEKGLNIEGLCASADGRTIYIGFRNPQPYSRATSRPSALVVPLNNPSEVIEKQAQPVFGDPMLWDLEGLGIRSMEYSTYHKAYFIIAGPHNEQPIFALYRWAGAKDTPPVLVRQIQIGEDNFTPEALVSFAGSPENCARFLLLSDDGSLLINVSGPSECMKGKLIETGKCLNKYLTDQNKKFFRGSWLKL